MTRDEIFKLVEQMVEQDGRALAFVPIDLRSEKLSRLAVQQDGWALKYVQQQTPEICLAAVQQNGDALRFVPEAWQAEILEQTGGDKWELLSGGN